MRVIDITAPLFPGTPVWPGDVAFQPVRTARIADGSSVNVGALTMSLHTGTHADAPRHVSDAGAAIDELPLDPYVGKAWVIALPGRGAINAGELEDQGVPPSARVLIKTRLQPPPAAWEADFRHLTPEAARWLAARGTVLVGIDTPSVDAPDSKSLESHHILFDSGAVILEGLNMLDTDPGPYLLVAAPVAVRGMDAGPVRAILIAAATDLSCKS
jgi:arylformamidase